MNTLTGTLRSVWLGAVVALAISPADAQAPGETLQAGVIAVDGGDAIRVRLPDGREETVRYIGIRAPEIPHPTKGKEPYWEAAAAANRALVQGKTVLLTVDVQARDPSGTLLAYVFADGVNVNAELVYRGYAEAATHPPNVRNAAYYRALQRQARAARRGLWGDPEASQHHRPDPDAEEARLPPGDPAPTVWTTPPPPPVGQGESAPAESPVVTTTPPWMIFRGVLVLPGGKTAPPLQVRPPPRPGVPPRR